MVALAQASKSAGAQSGLPGIASAVRRRWHWGCIPPLSAFNISVRTRINVTPRVHSSRRYLTTTPPLHTTGAATVHSRSTLFCHRAANPHRLLITPQYSSPTKKFLSSLSSSASPLSDQKMESEHHVLSGTLTEPRMQNPKEVNEMVHSMREGATRRKKAGGYFCKKTTFPLENMNLSIDSWKFNDWDYKKHNLPTYARGLFVYRDKNTENYRIAVRGYDKFFNINEVPKTRWSFIRENTKGPYELTLKENGCIIFMSALPDGSLLVCSKHSTGSRGGVGSSHAAVGERWIEKHLASVGKTKKDLAKRLSDLNATAVAELCDDEFEEHILAYEPERAGLYLHGINFNTPKFATCSQSEVQKFAEEFGMIKTDYIEMQDVDSLKKFLEDAAETGSWDGKDVEGFVIRCKARDSTTDVNWHDWFFKYKFEEPYLMYRQWREVTKSMLSGRDPKIKKHVQITKEYLAFARQYFKERPNQATMYQNNHGIIALRDAFLKHRGLKGSEIIKMEAETGAGSDPNTKLVLVPIATIGCGKTTLSIALSRLFKWGHVQNDNIEGSSRPQRFAKGILDALQNHSAVIADRNNHQKRERKQLFDDLSPDAPEAKFVALHYVHYRPDVDADEYRNRICKVTRDRVFSRGDNHQTIQAVSKPQGFIINIMEGFMKRFEPVDDEAQPDFNFDKIIDLDIEADTRTNLETVALSLRESYPNIIKEMPTSEQMDEAIQFALSEYRPTKPSVTKTSEQQQRQQQQKAKTPPIEYFAINLPHDAVTTALESAFKNHPDAQQNFYEHLKSLNRVQKAFHVTLIHCASLKGPGSQPRIQSIWSQYHKLLAKQKQEAPEGEERKIINVPVKLNKAVWNGQLMAIAAEILPIEENGEKTLPCMNEVAHVTVGTVAPEIKPKESNTVLTNWKAGKEEGIQHVDLGGVVVTGTFAGVPQK
ncbi:RNA ligase-domain-containing protein [Kalaharituber pfeilii]|nr:RNA ligase-domain-containing protein [Kalaharituber pfeilii]